MLRATATEYILRIPQFTYAEVRLLLSAISGYVPTALLSPENLAGVVNKLYDIMDNDITRNEK